MRKAELTDGEKAELQSWLIALIRTREYQWLQYRNGLLDSQTWQAFLSGITANLIHPRTRKWWAIVSYDFFNDEFVDEVNRALADTPVVTDYILPLDRADALLKEPE